MYDTCVKNLVDGLFSGYNATVFAYGQTVSLFLCWQSSVLMLCRDLVKPLRWEAESSKMIPAVSSELFHEQSNKCFPLSQHKKYVNVLMIDALILFRVSFLTSLSHFCSRCHSRSETLPHHCPRILFRNLQRGNTRSVAPVHLQ